MNTITIELSGEDRGRLDKLLAAVDALNASLLANQGMIAIADAGTHAEQSGRRQSGKSGSCSAIG